MPVYEFRILDVVIVFTKVQDSSADIMLACWT